VTFVYQDGRSQAVGTYTSVASGGRFTMRLSNQSPISGTFSARTFTLTGCGAVLRWAVEPQQCAFTVVG
jgi:hypothetical protein